MTGEFRRETNYSVSALAGIAVYGTRPNLHNPMPNCKAMSELGIELITGKNPIEHAYIETLFSNLLHEKEINRCIKLTALFFLKHPKAKIGDGAEIAIILFENDSGNTDIVSEVKKRFAQ